jgi:homoserine O-succinyltransferase/O-acetyltransferase
MPVYLDPCSTSHSDNEITIGLINNMPDAALKATERQFLSLLESASEDLPPILLSLYTLPGVPRSEAAQQYLSRSYASAETLWGHHLDGLIVTGRGPLTADLKDEPYWESFTNLLEWAQENTHSTVWSCLAAHAAILQMDDIGRRRNEEKRVGILDCAVACEHALTDRMPARFQIPHSRWNGITEDKLLSAGYDVLTRTAEGEVDMFVKQENSLFVFFHGHPEYDTDTLLREYRRDVGLYISGESDKYPLMPRNYFDQATEEMLRELAKRATSKPDDSFLMELSTFLGAIEIQNTWRSTARRIYTNWLNYIWAQKEKTIGLKMAPVDASRFMGVTRM